MQEPELEDERLTVDPTPRGLEIERSTLGDAPAPIDLIAPSGARSSVSLGETAPGLYRGEAQAMEQGLYEARSGDLRAFAAVGPLNPREAAALAADPENTLVLMACGIKKRDTDKAVPLYELYEGPLWQDLRTKGQKLLEPKNNVYVLSGKYGFISSWAPAKPYEEKISSQKVDALIERGVLGQERNSKGMVIGSTPYAEVHRSEHRGGPYSQVIIYGSNDYRRGFNAIVTQLQETGVIADGAPIVATEGTILQQRKQFNEFLRAVTGEEAAEDALSLLQAHQKSRGAKR